MTSVRSGSTLTIKLSSLRVGDLMTIAIGSATSHSGHWTWTAPTAATPAPPPPAGPPWAGGRRLPVALLPAVEGVVYQQPADRPIVVGDWSDLGSARAVGFGAAGVMVDQVVGRGDVQRVGHLLRRPTLARLPVYTPVYLRWSRLQ